MEYILMFAITFMLSLLVVEKIYTWVSKTNAKAELEELTERLHAIEIYKQNLMNNISELEETSKSANTKHLHLVEHEERALELYEKNRINLPLEVIEELAFTNTLSYDHALKVINNARSNMKSELNKKVVK